MALRRKRMNESGGGVVGALGSRGGAGGGGGPAVGADEGAAGGSPWLPMAPQELVLGSS